MSTILELSEGDIEFVTVPDGTAMRFYRDGLRKRGQQPSIVIPVDWNDMTRLHGFLTGYLGAKRDRVGARVSRSHAPDSYVPDKYYEARREHAWRMRLAGETYKAIAARLGVTIERVRQMEVKYRRNNIPGATLL